MRRRDELGFPACDASLEAMWGRDDREAAASAAWEAQQAELRGERPPAKNRAEAFDAALVYARDRYGHDDPHAVRVASRASYRWTRRGWRL